MGNGRAGHDLDGFAGTGLAVEGVAGANLADDKKLAGEIGRADGEPIAYGAGERGIVTIGAGVFGKYTSGSVKQTHFLNEGRGAELGYFRRYAIAAFLERDGRHSSYCIEEKSGAARTRGGGLGWFVLFDRNEARFDGVAGRGRFVHPFQ